MNVILDGRAVFVRTVVVRDDGSRTKVDALADPRIADVSQVVGLGTCAHLGVLDLDEIADVHAAGESGGRSESRERADVARGTDDGAVHDAMAEQLGVVADFAVANDTARTDADAIPKLYIAFQHNVYVEEHVRTVRDLATHVDSRRIG